MINVLKSIKPVIKDLKKVSISQESINSLVSTISKEDLKISEIALAGFSWNLDQLIKIVFTFNTINFCFWAEEGKPKWTINTNGQKLDGATALFRTLENKTRQDEEFTSGASLANLTETDVKNLLKGNVEIPLLKDRLNCLNEAGSVLVRKYDGDWLNILKESENNAEKLVELLVNNFPSFNDISLYNSHTVGFYKRAQLNAKMVSDTLTSKNKKELASLEKLTAFADYKIPQTLRMLGVLKYSANLANKIDNIIPIPQNSIEEIEIRVAALEAVERIREGLSVKFPKTTASHIDSLLWNRSQKINRNKNPYHRTYTIAY